MHSHQLIRPEAPESALVKEAKSAASGLWDTRDEKAELEAIAVKLIEARNFWESRPRKYAKMPI